MNGLGKQLNWTIGVFCSGTLAIGLLLGSLYLNVLIRAGAQQQDCGDVFVYAGNGIPKRNRWPHLRIQAPPDLPVDQLERHCYGTLGIAIDKQGPKSAISQTTSQCDSLKPKSVTLQAKLMTVFALSAMTQRLI
jgi:hypothetical protein